MHSKVAELQKREKKVDELEQKGVQELERISGLTSDQAKDELLRSVEDDVKVDVARLYKELEHSAKKKRQEGKGIRGKCNSEMCSRSCC